MYEVDERIWPEYFHYNLQYLYWDKNNEAKKKKKKMIKTQNKFAK